MKDFIRKYLPEPEAVLARKWAAPFRPWLDHPNLWHFNRRSVPGAVAVGLFCGMIPGPVQMLAALLCAIPCRSNIPLAMFVTWYTNPFTIVPIYLVAYEIGRLLLGYAEPQAVTAPPEWQWTLVGMWRWVMSLGKPLGVGMVALAVALALVGYFVTALGWRWRVVHAWRRRRLRSARR